MLHTLKSAVPGQMRSKVRPKVNIIPVYWRRGVSKPIWFFAVGLLFSLIAFIRMLFDPQLVDVSSTTLQQIVVGVGIVIPIGYLTCRVFCSKRTGVRQSLKYVFLYALLFRLAWAAIMYVWSVGVGREGAIAQDDAYYYYLGHILADSLRVGEWPPIPTFGGYYVFNAFVDVLSGSNYFMTLAINSLVGAITVVYVYRLATLVCDERVGWWAAILVAVSPELGMWSAANLKDSQLILCIVACTFWLVRFVQSGRWQARSLALFVIANLYVASMRPIFTLFMTGISGVYLVASQARLLRGNTLVRIMIGLVIFTSIVLVTGYYPGGPRFSTLEKYDEAGESLAASYSGDSLLGAANPAAIRARPYLLLPALGFALITPFPFWNLTVLSETAEAMLATPGVLFWYIAALPALYGAVVSFHRNWRAVLPILGWAAFIWVGGALEGGGAIFRYRAPMLPFAFILAAVGLAEARRWRSLIPLYTLGFAGLCAAYIILKA